MTESIQFKSVDEVPAPTKRRTRRSKYDAAFDEAMQTGKVCIPFSTQRDVEVRTQHVRDLIEKRDLPLTVLQRGSDLYIVKE